MTLQNNPVRNITFEKHSPFLLVPDEMLTEVILRCQKGPQLLLALDSFFPPDLISYLEQVLEINRPLSILPRRGSRSSDRSIYNADNIKSDCCGNRVLPLLLTQLGGLRIDHCLWFSHLDYEQTADNEGFLRADYTSEARKIGREGGIFLYHSPESGMFGETFKTRLERLQ